MIGENETAANTFLNLYSELVRVNELSLEKQTEYIELINSILSPRFPGGVLAYPRSDETTIYYGIADTPDQWRKLRPLLLAFAGPTLTSFNGCPESFKASLPLEEFLLSKMFYVVARFIPGKEVKRTQTVRRSLVRMIDTITNAPIITHSLPEPTSRLIAQFVDFLNGNNINGAERILSILKSELRLDALNLSFLRIQLYAHFSNWKSVTEMPEFASLCYTRKPPIVTVALLEALYQTEMSTFEGDDWLDKQRDCWKKKVREFARPLLRLPIPGFCSVGALKLYAWEALDSEERNQELEQAILFYEESIGELASVLRQKGRDGLSEKKTDTNAVIDSINPSIASVQTALVNAEGIDTLCAISNALTQIDSLSDGDKKQLLKSELFRSILQNINFETNGALPPTGWIDWLNRLGEAEFNIAHTALRHAVNEWPASELIDPSEVNKFADKLLSLQDIPLAADRIADSIPQLTSWVSDDPEFPRPSMTPIYETLFFHLVVSVRRHSYIYNSATVLIRALLTNGLTAQQYGSLLNDCIALLGESPGIRNVYWLLDILEETVINPAPSIEKRDNFWFKVWGLLQPLRSHLGPGQYISLSKIAISQGWAFDQIEEITVPVNTEEILPLSDALSNKSIAIYSLTESAARQAKNILNEIAPNAVIYLSHDKVGSDALKSMAQNSDIFVVATASAKHAATGFIQKIRPREKPLLFAAGRGFSSILRVIEDFALGLE
jgi:hypothetical protein